MCETAERTGFERRREVEGRMYRSLSCLVLVGTLQKCNVELTKAVGTRMRSAATSRRKAERIMAGSLCEQL